MPNFTIPVRQEVPAYTEITVEADSLEQACMQVKEDIETNGDANLLDGAEFTADWGESHDLKVADVMLPGGKVFSDG